MFYKIDTSSKCILQCPPSIGHVWACETLKAEEFEENIQVLLISSIMRLSMVAGARPVTKLAAFRRLVHCAAGARAEAGAGPKPGRSMAKWRVAADSARKDGVDQLRTEWLPRPQLWTLPPNPVCP